MVDLAIISGSGFYELAGIENREEKAIKTKFGETVVTLGSLNDRKIAFFSRHGKGHKRLPNMIDYRSMLQAIKDLKAKAIIATTVCGVIKKNIPLAKVAVFDDLYFPDNRLPNGEICSIYTSLGDPKRGHYIAKKPFNEQMRKKLIGLAKDSLPNITYAHVNGPRFNTKTEIKALQQHADYISQTSGPEAVLAGELEIPYALLGFGIDYANGVVESPTPIEALKENLAISTHVFTRLIENFLVNYEAPSFEGLIYRFD